jgi:hypothetical protein
MSVAEVAVPCAVGGFGRSLVLEDGEVVRCGLELSSARVDDQLLTW